jgi:S-formylglutathione hydrolase FrmB
MSLSEVQRRARGRRRGGLTMALTLLAVGLPVTAASAQQIAPPTFSSGQGLQVQSVQRLDQRLYELTLTTSALPGPAKVRILLPAGYEQHSARRYPVLYLLHGTVGAAADWTAKGEAEQTTEGLPLIVVMPDIGLNGDGGGYCTNWVSGTYSWETFHIEQLLPWVEVNLHTKATRKGRAIAGLSQGGFCSLSYAARHPDLFQTALAYSGVPDIGWNPADIAGMTGVIGATETLDGEPPNSMFGDRATNEINWADHDPATLASNLRGTSLFEYTGNGQPGPLEETPEAVGMSVEALVHEDNVHFHERLAELAIPVTYDDYGPGTHSWPYWARDLRWTIGDVMANFKHPPAEPRRVNYTIADPEYSVFGWTVSMHRAAEEFSTLGDANRRGFALSGSGSATVTTPPIFTPAASYRIEEQQQEGSTQGVVQADPDGRLRIDVSLGPANPYQQYTAAADALGTDVYTTRVRIATVATG